jgi:DNA-binding beta-propeller fold protein YncE
MGAAQLALRPAIALSLVTLLVLAACGSPGQAATAPPTSDASAAVASPTITPTATRAPLSTVNMLPSDSPVEFAWQIDTWQFGLERPSRLTIDGDGNAYAIDNLRQRVLKFDAAGQLIATWESTTDRQFMFRTSGGAIGGIAVDSQGNLYITDGLNRVQKLDRDGNPLGSWGGEGKGDGEFSRPGGLALDREGNIYVTDWDNHRVQKFDSSGRFLTKWGAEGVADGFFQRPWSIAVDERGNVYVADRSFRIQKFTAAGKHLATWGVAGSGAAEFRGAISLTVSPQGAVFAADMLNHRVQVFDSDGNYTTQWGEFGEAIGQFRWPGGVGVDRQGNIYVSDILNGRIVKFRPRVAWPTTSRGTPTPRPATPTPSPVPTNTPSVKVFLTPTDR